MAYRSWRVDITPDSNIQRSESAEKDRDRPLGQNFIKAKEFSKQFYMGHLSC